MAQTRSGKGIPDATHRLYRDRHRFPGWTREVSFEREHRLARKIFPTWTHADHEDAARWHNEVSHSVARGHGCIYERAVARYGKPPRLIAGLVGENFPESINERLREAARLASDHQSIAHSHWKAAGKRKLFEREFGFWQYSMPCRGGEAVGLEGLGAEVQAGPFWDGEVWFVTLKPRNPIEELIGGEILRGRKGESKEALMKRAARK